MIDVPRVGRIIIDLVFYVDTINSVRYIHVRQMLQGSQ
jgi:hypothetical protein